MTEVAGGFNAERMRLEEPRFSNFNKIREEHQAQEVSGGKVN